MPVPSRDDPLFFLCPQNRRIGCIITELRLVAKQDMP